MAEITPELPSYAWCPRCRVEILIEPTRPGVGKALSRMTRDEGADVFVCLRCSEKEAYRPMLWGLPQVPLTGWPLSLDDLQAEDRLFYEIKRQMKIEAVRPERLEPAG